MPSSPIRHPSRSAEFHRAIDPLFLELIALISDEGELNKKTVREIQELQTTVEQLLKQVDARIPNRDLALYAIVCWIDDVVGNCLCEGAGWWRTNSLEQRLFPGPPDGEVEFFVKSKEAAESPDEGALSVYLVCVALGFKGAYREAELNAESSPARRLAQQQLPPTRVEWLDQNRRILKRRRERPPEPRVASTVGSQEPLLGVPRLIRAMLVLALSITAGFVYFVWIAPLARSPRPVPIGVE